MRFTVLLRPASEVMTPPDCVVVRSCDELIEAKPELVVEAAGQQAVTSMAPAILGAGVSFIPASTGAFSDEAFLAQMASIAARSGARLILPSGAIGGLDYVVASRGAGDLAVRYTSRKPPHTWMAELAALGLDGATLTQEHVLFEGAPAEAASRYPRNLNAGLTVALAAGADVTRVRVIADPALSQNTHEIEIESALGSAFMRFANLPAPDNPKTSALTAASIAAVAWRYFSPVVI
jgi:aspartate dehydrogenase